MNLYLQESWVYKHSHIHYTLSSCYNPIRWIQQVLDSLFTGEEHIVRAYTWKAKKIESRILVGGGG